MLFAAMSIGQLPPSLGALQSLSNLYLSENLFEGGCPA